MKETLTNTIKAADVAGAEFPTAVPLEFTSEYIIINGVKCELLIQVDQ
jgi:Na+-translocating ferredoxin:NAD+ oxidoreductase RnfC subunit